MRNGFLALLKDPTLKERFDARFPLRSYDELAREAAKEVSGDAVAAKILARLKNPSETCFVAGTSVWTENGLIPIEQIRVGDLVLSQNEHTGERGMKRVVQTFVHERQKVVKVRFWIGEDGDTEELIATPNHPIWIQESGWTAIGDLVEGNPMLLATGAAAWASRVYEVYRSARDPNDFWYYDPQHDQSWLSVIPDGADSIRPIPGRSGELYLSEEEDPYYRFTVYNFEVEDFHTYFVGEEGFLVHNKNAPHLTLKSSNGSLPPAGTPVYYSMTELNGDIQSTNRHLHAPPCWGLPAST